MYSNNLFPTLESNYTRVSPCQYARHATRKIKYRNVSSEAFKTFYYFEQHMFFFCSRNTIRDNFSNRSIIWYLAVGIRVFFTRVEKFKDLPRIGESSFTWLQKKEIARSMPTFFTYLFREITIRVSQLYYNNYNLTMKIIEISCVYVDKFQRWSFFCLHDLIQYFK